MDFAEVPAALKAVIVIVGAIITWMVLRLALRFTVRLFTLGCAAIAVLVIIGGIATWLG
ncbi:MAG: hypothetical protein BMS9Abin28_0457 [Anaerolineae bacterium]|nr:MAG: hypothetical protein BMS9Abin28_0457 [Anaerolineae bacterium]